MMDTRHRLVAAVVALLVATSLLAGLPVSGATAPGDEAARQDPASVAISDRLQSSTGEVVVVARLETPSIPQAASVTTAQQRLKTQADLVTFADQTNGVDVLQRFWLGNTVLLEIDTSRTSLRSVASVRGVQRLHPNYEFAIPETNAGAGAASGATTDAVDSDAAYTYGLEQLNVPDVWQDFGTKGGGAKVAVLDTGIQADHPAIDL